MNNLLAWDWNFHLQTADGSGGTPPPPQGDQGGGTPPPPPGDQGGGTPHTGTTPDGETHTPDEGGSSDMATPDPLAVEDDDFDDEDDDEDGDWDDEDDDEDDLDEEDEDEETNV